MSFFHGIWFENWKLYSGTNMHFYNKSITYMWANAAFTVVLQKSHFWYLSGYVLLAKYFVLKSKIWIRSICSASHLAYVVVCDLKLQEICLLWFGLENIINFGLSKRNWSAQKLFSICVHFSHFVLTLVLKRNSEKVNCSEQKFSFWDLSEPVTIWKNRANQAKKIVCQMQPSIAQLVI